MKKFSHMYDIGFSVISDDENAKDVTPEMLKKAISEELENYSKNSIVKACGKPSHTFKN